MHILLIGNAEKESNCLLAREAQQRGHTLTIAAMSDVGISIDATATIVIHHKLVTRQSFDVALFRDIHPQFVSSTLTCALLLSTIGIPLIDTTLLERPFVWNKLHQLIVCQGASIRIPRTLFITHEQQINFIPQQFTFPLVIKPIHGSHGTLITRCDTIVEVRNILSTAPFGTFLTQTYLDAPHDYRVIVINYKAIGAVKKIPAPNEFRTNTDLGATFEPYEMTHELRSMAQTAAKCLHIPIAGVDMREHKGQLHLLEVNRNPGFTTFQTATGINIAEHIINFLEQSLL